MTATEEEKHRIKCFHRECSGRKWHIREIGGREERRGGIVNRWRGPKREMMRMQWGERGMMEIIFNYMREKERGREGREKREKFISLMCACTCVRESQEEREQGERGEEKRNFLSFSLSLMCAYMRAQERKMAWRRGGCRRGEDKEEEVNKERRWGRRSEEREGGTLDQLK